MINTSQRLWPGGVSNHPKQPIGHDHEYLAARRALTQALDNEGIGWTNPVVRQRAIERLDESFDHAFVERLLREALTTSDPMKGALLLMAAELMQQLHQSSPLLQRAKRAGFAGRALQHLPNSVGDMQSRLRLVDRLIAIVRELRGK